MKKRIAEAVLTACMLMTIFTYTSETQGSVYVNGHPVTDVRTYDDLKQQYITQYPDAENLLSDKGLEKEYISKDISFQKTVPLSVAKIFHTEIKPTVSYQGTDGSRDMSQVLRDMTEKFNSSHHKDAVNAKAVYDKKKNRYVIKPSETGEELSYDRLLSLYRSGKKNITLPLTIKKPLITENDLKEAVDEANRLLEWHITYSSGYTVRYPHELITIKGTKVQVADYGFRNELLHLDSIYGTAGQKKTVRLHNERKYSTVRGSWGDLTDSAEERKFLKSFFKKGRSVEDRKPEMKKRTPDVIIEVSKSAQHVWVYRPDGKKVMDSPCVTGRRGVHDTPTGVYYISQRAKEYNMRGDGYVSHCKRFMRITNTGVALHDASWRSVFGGNIYTYNGSHGCVNLPTAFALKLYDRVTTGRTMVIVH